MTTDDERDELYGLREDVKMLRADLAAAEAQRDQFEDWWTKAEHLRMDVEKVLDAVLGTEEEDGAGAGLVADVRLALAKAWDEGAAAGAEYESRRSSPDPEDWEGLEIPPNPFRANPSDNDNPPEAP